MIRRILVVASLVLGTSGVAGAGGLQLSTRGVRPTARGGAFVAGADDLGALWFNPAGLAELAGGVENRAFLFDLGFVSQSTSYTRIDSGMNTQPTVESDAPGLPIPTLGLAWDLGDKAVLAGGVYAPYAALGRYPQDGPQRYSLIDMSESLLIIMEAAIGYQITDKIRIGVGVQNMIFRMASTIVFSGCPGQTVCAPEDPEFDALSKVNQLDMFNPSGVVGVQMAVSDKLHVGAAFQLPFFISGTGDFDTVLPDSGFYDNATVVGDKVDVSFRLAPILRAGVEYRPTPLWRVELAGNIEFWSVHKAFELTPKNVRIEGAPGVGTYELGPLTIPRHYKNTYAVNLGIEGRLSQSSPLTVLAGYSYETAAAPDEYLSVLTVDGAKNLFAGGLGYRTGPWEFNATVGFVKVSDRTVDPAEGMSPQLTPVRDDPDDPDPLRTYVNWGSYSSSWLLAGLGVNRSF